MMITAVWAYRGLAVRIAPVLIGILMFGAWSRNGWQYEWLWGMRGVLAIMPLVAPLVAAGVAFDMRRWEPLIATLGPSTQRWRAALLALPVAHVIVAFGGVCVVWITVAVRLAAHEALWQLDPWLPMEVLAALSAAAGIGLILGRYVRNLLAAPLAAILVFALEALAAPYGMSSLFAPMALVDSAVGLERDPRAAGLSIALNLAASLWCGAVALRSSEAPRMSTISVALSSTLLVAVIVAPASWAPLEYRASTDSTICVRDGKVQTCGPRSVRPLLRDLSLGLDDASTKLGSSGLPLPQTFFLAIPGVVGPERSEGTVAAVAPVDLAGVNRTTALARILATPRVCPQFMDPDQDTVPLLDRQERVQRWIAGALRGGELSAPQTIRTEYGELVACRLATP